MWGACVRAVATLNRPPPILMDSLLTMENIKTANNIYNGVVFLLCLSLARTLSLSVSLLISLTFIVGMLIRMGIGNT